jgi:hypothetical protein
LEITMPNPPFRRGEPITADRMNRELAPIDRMRIAGAEIPPAPPKPIFAPVPGLWVKLVAEFNDYLEVQAANGTTDAIAPGTFYIAKPYKLQHDADHYESVTSLSTTNPDEVEVDDGGGGEDAETWLVTPSYQVGDFLYATHSTGTGITVDGVLLDLVDFNADGRAWAVEL